ncbi:Extracellular ligand-binding receptor [Acidovorax delafieldii 2AN]|uniref:Extracellular ligand-binding receptor n=1 Tax=Acidovorax delafieldii 2AN TaxID=573060 RepID=C5T0A8_ACIDE|nr:ABC transporter substrate-binding protein [Acidovorax delafieldii]EER62061.1 Extracellular ligand-binding receptor [Acidovorax delafieldii 2AN]
MKISHSRRAFASSTMLGFGLSCLGFDAGAQGQESVKIGVLLSLSGAAATFGIPERDMVKVLAEKYNAEGGFRGRKLELVFHDDQTNPTESARGATKLIQQDKVVVIIGPTIGSAALAVLPIAARAQVPVLTPVGTISVTAKENSFFPWVFRTCPNDELLVTASMETAVLKAGYKRLAVMYQEDAYGKNSAAFAEKFAKEHGIEIVSLASAPAAAVDLSATATRIRAANPDSVLLWTSTPAMGAAFVRAARQVGLNVPIIGSGALVQRSFIETAGSAAENVTILAFANWDDPSPKLKKLGALLRTNGKTPSGFGELLTATGMAALTAALAKVEGPVTGARIRDALEKVCGIDNPYVDGKFCYSADSHEGFGSDALQAVTVRDGKFRSIAPNPK